MKHSAAFLTLFLFIFAPFLRFGGVTIHLPYFVTVGLAVMGLRTCVKSPEVINLGRIVTLSLLALLAYGLIVGTYLNTYDSEFYLQVAIGLSLIPAGIGMVELYTGIFKDRAVHIALWHLFFIGVLHSAIMLLTFSSEMITDFLYTYVPLSEKGLKFVELRIRAPGLTSAGGDVLSGIHAVLAVIGLYVAILNWSTLAWLKKSGLILGFYLLLASLSLSARTGYVVILALLPCLFFVLAWRSGRQHRLFNLVQGFLAFFLMTVFVFGSFSSLLEILGEERAYKRSAEVIASVRETGEVKISSVDALKDMYFVPTENWSFFFGTGDLGRNKSLGYLASDIGYVRSLNGFGVVGIALMYLPILLIGLNLLRVPVLLPAQVVLGLCVAAILVLNLKVFYFWGLRDVFKVMVLMLFFSGAQHFPKISVGNDVKLSSLK